MQTKISSLLLKDSFRAIAMVAAKNTFSDCCCRSDHMESGSGKDRPTFPIAITVVIAIM